MLSVQRMGSLAAVLHVGTHRRVGGEQKWRGRDTYGRTAVAV